MFPHTVTLYNVSVEEDEYSNSHVTNNITILKGVLYDASKAVNVRISGMEGADAVNLYIPFSVDTFDSLYAGTEDHPKKKYVGPKEYDAAEDKSGIWTLKPDQNCFFVKGEAIASVSTKFGEINRLFDDVHVVTKVDTKDFGTPDMQHWEIGGA